MQKRSRRIKISRKFKAYKWCNKTIPFSHFIGKSFGLSLWIYSNRFLFKIYAGSYIKSNVLTYSDEKIRKLFIWCETVKDTYNNTFI